jgi:hypothetical protein
MTDHDTMLRSIRKVDRFKTIRRAGYLFPLSILMFVLAVMLGIEDGDTLATAFMWAGFIGVFSTIILGGVFIFTYPKKEKKYRKVIMNDLWTPLLDALSQGDPGRYRATMEASGKSRYSVVPLVSARTYEATLFSVTDIQTSQEVRGIHVSRPTGSQGRSVTEFVGLATSIPFDGARASIKKDTVTTKLAGFVRNDGIPWKSVSGYLVDGAPSDRMNEMLETFKSKGLEDVSMHADGHTLTVLVGVRRPLPGIGKDAGKTLSQHKKAISDVLVVMKTVSVNPMVG